MTELKPCPFCGGEAGLGFFPLSPGQGKWYGYCTRCDATFWRATGERVPEERAIEAWNRRSVQAPVAPSGPRIESSAALVPGWYWVREKTEDVYLSVEWQLAQFDEGGSFWFPGTDKGRGFEELGDVVLAFKYHPLHAWELPAYELLTLGYREQSAGASISWEDVAGFLLDLQCGQRDLPATLEVIKEMISSPPPSNSEHVRDALGKAWENGWNQCAVDPRIEPPSDLRDQCVVEALATLSGAKP